MAKVEIDTPTVTVRIDDPNAGAELDARALALYREAVAVDTTAPQATGSGNGLITERRGTGNLGFGTWHRQAKTPEAQAGGIDG